MGDGSNSFVEKFSLRLTGKPPQIPADIEDWLGRLLLLYGAPFHYLVPEEDMLPPESIRFFFVDPGWIKCLLEGACSVGRSSIADQLVDQYLRSHFLDRAGKKAAELRAQAGSKAEDAAEEKQRNEKETDLRWPLTGFLLRSAVVEGWQGLEMKAVGIDAQGKPLDPLEPLRIDRLNPEIMLCIFNGQVTSIEIAQPPEGMHFGAIPKKENAYQKTLRKLFPRDQAGDQLNTPFLDVPMRNDARRVINIKSLADSMKKRLNDLKAIDGTEQGLFTSAEFAVQMIESPGKAIFTVKP